MQSSKEIIRRECEKYGKQKGKLFAFYTIENEVLEYLDPANYEYDSEDAHELELRHDAFGEYYGFKEAINECSDLDEKLRTASREYDEIFGFRKLF